ncbi:SMP-30/gluconolactonase/LRE family protein [Emticicia sp. BO119]|uniref:SMP-30/gluconolactonase/LRE family protein n=1 Tax=Emticicia sp. BO119 TaxID=2757768 RepID=UPI0015F0121E|nr:SMP-30/gluconolactonase/LRE family protein [Emticicia sp. BO119]MBA4851731.1 SMP-30/gluconolactonase/LRE family protein [Emticicia sp. BO119]
MKKLLFTLLACWQVTTFAQTPNEKYTEDPASVEQVGVPKGEILKFEFADSKIFPGTWREYWVYIPAQYTPDRPACVYVNQDGIQWKAPTVFDNLIHKKEMPVTIGVFVMHGRVKAANGETALDRFNRSYEYDGLGDNYARFILDEILPEVEKKKTSDGRAIRLSKNGNDRAIGGSSSGAVCAFTAAWERPDAFSRVFSAIGTYVGLRGANEYPTLIRKYEPKPIRVYLQDGTNDLNIYAGDWWKSNELMERALIFAGYEVNHVWGEGGHNGKHGTAVFPEAMRWLWKDYPKPVTGSKTKNPFLSDILIDNEGWELVGEGYTFTEGTAANAAGEVFYQDIPNSKTYKVGIDGKLTTLEIDAKKSSGTAFSPDGKRYVVAGGAKQIISYDATGKETVVADNQTGNDIVVAKNGNVYITAPNGVSNPSKLYLIRPNGEKVEVDEGLKFANGLTLSPDQTQLYVTESASHWVWVYQIQPDGRLFHKQKYGWLHVRDTDENAWSDGLKCDRDGRVYVTTLSGIQVLDQTGRVNAILPVPKTKGQVSNLCFGGPNFDVMYITCVDKVYRRKVKVKGANTFDTPTKPAAPKL